MTSRHDLSEGEIERICLLRERDRLTITQLATRFDVNDETIRTVLKKHSAEHFRLYRTV